MTRIADMKAVIAGASPDWQAVDAQLSTDTGIGQFALDGDCAFAVSMRANVSYLVALYDWVNKNRATLLNGQALSGTQRTALKAALGGLES